jgi:hypothetical protein
VASSSVLRAARSAACLLASASARSDSAIREQFLRLAEQRAVLQGHRGLAGQDPHHRLVGALEGAVPGRPRRERADHTAVELDRHNA